VLIVFEPATAALQAGRYPRVMSTAPCLRSAVRYPTCFTNGVNPDVGTHEPGAAYNSDILRGTLACCCLDRGPCAALTTKPLCVNRG
jgi:hypothetical protein